jgi:hypothetical protein
MADGPASPKTTDPEFLAGPQDPGLGFNEAAPRTLERSRVNKHTGSIPHKRALNDGSQNFKYTGSIPHKYARGPDQVLNFDLPIVLAPLILSHPTFPITQPNNPISFYQHFSSSLCFSSHRAFFLALFG